MNIKLKENQALKLINLMVSKTNQQAGRSISFLGFKNGCWVGSSTKLIVKCNIHNTTTEVSYNYFTRKDRKVWSCPECAKENRIISNLKCKTEEEALILINNKIEEINSSTDFKRDISFLGFKDNSFIKSGKQKIIIRCNIHNITAEIYLSKFLRYGYMCKKCSGEKSGKIRGRISNLELYNELTTLYKDKNYDFSLILNDEELGAPSIRIIKVICPVHGEFSCSLLTLKSGKATCPSCKKELSKEDNLKRMEQKVIESINRKRAMFNLDYEFLGFHEKYEGYYTRLILKCNKHNTVWDTTRFGVFCSDTVIGGCPICHLNTSIKEEECYKILCELISKEKIVRQFRVENCNINNKTRFILIDFYIPNLNLIIEYSGEQHYKYNIFFHDSYDVYIEQVLRDSFLKDYCKEHNISFLEIPFLDNNRLNEVINTFIKSGKDISTKIIPESI